MTDRTAREHRAPPDPRRSRLVVLENTLELRQPPAVVFDYLSDIRNERE